MTQRNVLIIGSGGREHALAWALSRSPQVQQVFIAPGNAGTQWPANESASGLQPRAASQNVPVPTHDFPALVQFARENAMSLTVIGPEAPLAAGIVDAFQAAGLKVFGPTQAAAQLEASKTFSKHFMRDHKIPTAAYGAFSEYHNAWEFLTWFQQPVVVKADGLAAGKGVLVCDTRDEAQDAARYIMLDRAFGAAGDRIVIEERLNGREISVLAFIDGETIVPMPVARDHKRALDGDLGLNTGGMGAFAPTQDVSQALIDEVVARVLRPTVDGMAALGAPYMGVLYAGLMLTPRGIQVLEFNCRFGDPETQAILPLLKTDLYSILSACVEGRLHEIAVEWQPQTCASVVVASPGYPDSYPTGLPIFGLNVLPDDVIVFHAGTSRQGDQVVTAGGRVLAVSAVGDHLPDALERAYSGVERIHFDGMHYRRDIGKTTVEGEPKTSAYAQAGVNIDAGHRAVEMIKPAVRATYGPEVLSNLGSFGGLFSAAALKQMDSPVLVASTDGVGTKTRVAAHMNQWGGIGHDIVNHCINDILVQGATPLFFMDYVASRKLDPQQFAAVINGMAEACRAAGCALLGGEMAEMPGVYAAGEIDVVGTIVGVVEQGRILDGSRIQPGDAILALPSDGLHTNGFSLARRALANLDWKAVHPDLGTSPGEALLVPHRCYLPDVRTLWGDGIDIHGLAHLTGGGLLDNLPRILPAGAGALIKQGTWPVLPIFRLIQQLGGVDEAEMFRVFNMGMGMLVVLPSDHVEAARAALNSESYLVGEIVADASGVTVVA